jgi:DNA-binding GntR family transcriptional regulator
MTRRRGGPVAPKPWPSGRRHSPTEQRVYDALHQQIVDGELPPGWPLRLELIAQRLDASTTPVRSALVRLEWEGLVRRSARRGSIVAPLELEDIEEIQAIRWGIEGLAARLGAAAATDGTIALMRDHLERIGRASTSQHLDGYLDATYALEDTCYLAAQRPRLLETVRHYRQAAQRYVRFVMRPESATLRVEPAIAFFEAAEARDGLLAERLMQREIEGLLERLTQAIRANGEP